MIGLLLAIAGHGVLGGQMAGSDAAAARLGRMVALYDEVCLKTFPDDGALDALMRQKGATALTPEQVKATLEKDPGRGWLLKDGSISAQVTLELPPYHACSVRFPMPEGDIDLRGYREVATKFEAAHPTFATIAPYEADVADVHVHAVGERRSLAGNQGVESLFVIDQHLNDPVRRAAGETGTMLRFVRQLAPPGS